MGSSQPGRLYSFGDFQVDLRAGEVRKGGIKIRMPEQSVQVLAALLEKPGELVSRADMRRRLWPDGTHTDFDHGVNKAVSRLRQGLCDSAASPRFIQTVAHRGYRLIAPVSLRAGYQGGEARARKVRLAVLPFTSLTADLPCQHFCQGLAEELTLQLAQINPQRLGVLARSAATSYKHSGKCLDEIASELGVDYVLEGSVRGTEERVRITAQLIEVSEQTLVWADSYDRGLSDNLAVQLEVSRLITRGVVRQLLPETPPRAHAESEFQDLLRIFAQTAVGTDELWGNPAKRPI